MPEASDDVACVDEASVDEVSDAAEAAEAAQTAGPAPCRTVLCRDCCCGSAKVTGLDHAAQTARLREEAPVRVSACLDVCEQANVIVVQPSAGGRAAGGRPVWLGLVNSPDATEDVAAWVRAGGPGVAPLPDILDLHVIAPPRRGLAGNRRASSPAPEQGRFADL